MECNLAMKRNDVQRYMTQYAKGSQSCMIPFIVIGKLAKSVEIEDFYFLEIENRLNNKGQQWQIVWGGKLALSFVVAYTKAVKRLNARHNCKGRMGLSHQGSPESRLVVASIWEK